MPLVAGADGCPGGWAVVTLRRGRLDAFVAGSLGALAERLPSNSLIGIDMAIGLAERGDRECCRAARALLGRPRASSVYALPVRGCLSAHDYPGANARQREIDGRGLSRQAWALGPKLREVDRFVRSPAATRLSLVEVHPEVSFAVWGGAPMRASKLTPPGRAERHRLIDARWPGERLRLWAQVRGSAAADDLADAFAALWSADRVRRGVAFTLPERPLHDRYGLPMAVHV